jgi:hypothetical protein
VSARLNFERLWTLLQSFRIGPPHQHPRVNDDTQDKARGEPEADQITDGALGEIEKSGRLILVHAGKWQIPPEIATTRGLRAMTVSARPRARRQTRQAPINRG